MAYCSPAPDSPLVRIAILYFSGISAETTPMTRTTTKRCDDRLFCLRPRACRRRRPASAMNANPRRRSARPQRHWVAKHVYEKTMSTNVQGAQTVASPKCRNRTYGSQTDVVTECASAACPSATDHGDGLYDETVSGDDHTKRLPDQEPHGSQPLLEPHVARSPQAPLGNAGLVLSPLFQTSEIPTPTT